MSSKEVGIEQARKVLGDLADAAHHQGEITLLTKYGRPYAAIVPMNLVPQEPTMTFATGTLSVTVPFDSSGVSETGNRAKDATYQWCDAAEAAGYGRIETVSYEVPDTTHDLAIVAVGDSTYLLTVRGGQVYADVHEYAGTLCRAPFAVNGVEQGWVCDLRKGHPGQHENTTTMGLPSTPVQD